MFDGLVAACVERIEQVNDKAMLEIIRSQHREISQSVAQISKSLSQLTTEERLNHATLKDSRTKVARSIEVANRLVSVETLQGTKKFKLKSLAIPSRVTPISASEIASAKMASNQDSVAYISFRRSLKRAVILGDPGGGKSTLTQLLCYDLSNLIILEENNPGLKDFDEQDLKIPLKIVLRSFEARKITDAAYTFFDFLRDEIRPALDNDRQLASRFLRNILATGEAIVIFDGLDEVLDIGERTTIVGQIEQFAEINAACSVLVTSRLVGYRDAPLSDEFASFGLSRFNADEISKYCAKSIKAVSGDTAKSAAAKAQEFVRQTTRIGGDLRENPLMLGLMVQIFVYRGDVPSNRPEVYKECATLMFEKWDGRRDIVVQNVPRDDMELLDVFGYVAHKTFGDVANEEGVSRQWLTQELRAHFEEWYIDKASAHRAAKSLVEFLTGRAWVMSEVGSGVFKFTHRTFLEYFFARHLISTSSGIREIVEAKLAPRILNGEWAVISHLALHMAVFRDGGKARQAAEAVLRTIDVNNVFPARQEQTLLEFIAGALDYLTIPESTYIEIAETVLERTVKLGARQDFSAVSVVWTIFQTAKTRTELAKKACDAVLGRYLDGDITPELHFCMYVLGSRHKTNMRGLGISRHLMRPNGVLWKSLEQLRGDHHDRLYVLGFEDLMAAKAYVCAYDQARRQLYEQHGMSFLNSSISPLVPVEVDQVLPIALARSAEALNWWVRGVRSDEALEDDSMDFVSAVAGDVISGKLLSTELKIAGDARGDQIEDYLESAIREMWNLPGGKRKPKHVCLAMAKVLLSSFFVYDGLSAARSIDAKTSKRKRVMFAPINVLRSLVKQVGETEYTSALEEWLLSKEELIKSANRLDPDDTLGTSLGMTR